MNFDLRSPEKYRAALYMRLSKEDDGQGKSQSIVNQLSLLREFTEQHGVEVFDSYADDGFSGGSFDRPDFKRLIADIEAKRVNMVITKDLSRLGRDYILTGHYLERYFPEHGVRYISVLDGIDTGAESSVNDITPFRAIMNDMYARDISRKIKSVKREKQRRGLFIGAKPVYGYKKSPHDKNSIMIDEDAAQIVRGIFESAAAGFSCRKIAQNLNAREIQPPSVYAGLAKVGKWSGERISEMLQNTTYVGDTVQGRRERASYKSQKCVRRTRENWVIVKNTHEPIVTKEVFEAAMMQLASRRTTRERKYAHLLKGLIYCHECGKQLAAVNRKTAGGDRLYFVCRTYQRDTRSGDCSSHCVSESLVTQAVMDAVNALLLNEKLERRLEKVAANVIKTAVSKEGRDVKTLKEELVCVDCEMDTAYKDKLEGVLQTRDFERVYSRLLQKRAELEQRLTRLNTLNAKPDVNEQAKALANRFVAETGSGRGLITALIERIELTAEKKLIIRFRCKDETSGG